MTGTMPYDDRDESGQFKPIYSSEDFVSAVSGADLPSTSEVAEIVGCKYRTAYEWLKRLEDEGRIDSREIGNSLVWMVPDEGGN